MFAHRAVAGLAMGIAVSSLLVAGPATSLASGAPVPHSCLLRAATIVGTPGDDVLRGTAGPDVMVGLGGADTLIGRGGDDVICGGTGRDTIVGGTGKDELSGGGGNDVVRGGAGNDSIVGGDGDDRLFGGDAKDVFWLGTGSDYAAGGPGRDLFYQQAKTGTDRLYGQGDNDTIYAASRSKLAGLVYSGGRGRDRLSLNLYKSDSSSDDTVNLVTDMTNGTSSLPDLGITFRTEGFEEVRLFGWQGASGGTWTVLGTSGADVVKVWYMAIAASMGAGDDTVWGSDFDDTVDGGDGQDTAKLGGGDDTCINVESTTSCEHVS